MNLNSKQMKRYIPFKNNIALMALLSVVFFLGTSVKMYGQALEPITPSTWSVSSHSDVANGKDYNKTSTVELTANELQWGTLPFTISSSSVNWDKQTNTGEINLSVTVDSSSGTVTIKGDDAGITILLNLVHENGSSMLLLQVNNVEY